MAIIQEHEEPTSGSPPSPLKPHVLPSTRVGWWGLCLLLVGAAFPAYWRPLGFVLHNNRAVVLLAIGLSAFAVSGTAIFYRRDRSVLLVVLFAIELSIAVLAGLLFLMMGLGGG
jgi:hypothetical protein